MEVGGNCGSTWQLNVSCCAGGGKQNKKTFRNHYSTLYLFLLYHLWCLFSRKATGIYAAAGLMNLQHNDSAFAMKHQKQTHLTLGCGVAEPQSYRAFRLPVKHAKQARLSTTTADLPTSRWSTATPGSAHQNALTLQT